MILSELLVLSELEIFNEDALEKLQKRTSILPNVTTHLSKT